MITAGEDVFGEGASRGMKLTQAGVYSAGFAFGEPITPGRALLK